MRKPLLFLVLFAMVPVFCLSQEIKHKNIIGISSGIVLQMEKGIYFGNPWDFWPKQEYSYPVQFFYARKLNDYLRLGPYLEYQRTNFSDNTGIIRSFRKYAAGVDVLGQYPTTRLHMQLGGYFGMGTLKAQNWDNLHGLEYGILAGPAFEANHIGIALHVAAGFAPFKSNGTPDEVLLYTPRIQMKVYLKI